MADLVLPVPSGMVGCWLAGVPDSITETSGAVSQWNDLSGNGLHFKQSASGSRPTKSTVFEGGAIDFASASFLSLDAAYTGITGDAYTVAMALNIPTWTAGYKGLSLQNSASKYLGLFDTTSIRQWQLYAGSGSTTTTSNTSMAGRKYLVVAGRAGTGSCVMRVDGSSQIDIDSATGNLEFLTFGRYDGTYGGFGSVAALIVWSRRLGLSEIETVEEFLASIVATGSPPYGYAFSGTVEGDDGAPAARAIRAFREDTGAYVGGAISDATTGAYTISTLYSGEHTVVAYPVTGENLPALVHHGVIPI